MKLGTAPFRFLAIAVFAVCASASAIANGVEFFNAQTDGPPVLYYFGHVKDTNGNVIDKLMITVSAKNVGMPDTKSYIGQQAYWQAATADKKK